MIDTASTATVDLGSEAYMDDLPAPVSPTTSTDGWGEIENGIHDDNGSDKDGWDDIEPLEDPKPSAVLATIQAAQKRPVTQPKQGISSKQKSLDISEQKYRSYIWRYFR